MAEHSATSADGTPEAAKDVHATVGGDAGHSEAPHVDPSALGLDATMWVALAMIAVIALAIWKKVPAAIAGMLDKRIGEIRTQLDEAKQLRAEAEALKAEYEAKAAAAIADAEAMRASAHTEAEAILAKAEADATALIGRRKAMLSSPHCLSPPRRSRPTRLCPPRCPRPRPHPPSHRST